MLRFVMVTVALACAAAPAAAQLDDQPPTPTTLGLGGFYTIGSGGNFGEDGGFTDANGTPGANPGYTLFEYGNAGGAGRLRINAPSGAPGSVTYWTAMPGTPNSSSAALNFDPAVRRQWLIVAPSAGTTATLEVRDADGSATFHALSDQAQLGAYNARLNEVLTFNSAVWIDPDTGGPISPTVGTFSFSFSNFDAGFNGGRYRSIDLVYTPVPEPAAVLALAAAAVAGWARVRRRRAV